MPAAVRRSSLIQFAVKVVAATRKPSLAGLGELERFITYGGSPRATINMIEAGRALAFLRGREYVLPEDVLDVTPDVLRHRIVLSYEAISRSITPDDLVGRLLKAIPAPEKPLESACPHRRDRLRKLLGRLEWTVIRRLDGLLQGDCRTLFRGFGLDFGKTRESAEHDAFSQRKRGKGGVSVFVLAPSGITTFQGLCLTDDQQYDGTDRYTPPENLRSLRTPGYYQGCVEQIPGSLS